MADEQHKENSGGNSMDSRLKDLLDDKANLSKTVEEKEKALREAQEKLAATEREKAFSDGFAEVLGTHQAAKDHKDEIKAKVLSGYSVEDATFAVLGRAGKLGGTPAVVPPSPAGGSAATSIPQGGQKTPAEMTQAERRAVLEKEMVWS